MTSRPPCCVMMTSMVFLLIAMVMLDVAYCGTTTQAPKPTTTEEPFLKSAMFVGLAAGLGGVVGFLILLCIIWKCCCGGRE